MCVCLCIHLCVYVAVKESPALMSTLRDEQLWLEESPKLCAAFEILRLSVARGEKVCAVCLFVRICEDLSGNMTVSACEGECMHGIYSFGAMCES